MKNGKIYSYQSGTFDTNFTESDTHIICIRDIMNKERSTYPEIEFKNIHLLALNCIE